MRRISRPPGMEKGKPWVLFRNITTPSQTGRSFTGFLEETGPCTARPVVSLVVPAASEEALWNTPFVILEK
jgi:hypothetical protein